jgi:hypothetical protein
VKREPSTADVLTELRCRLDLGHYPERVARRVEAAFERHANGDPDGLVGLLRAARHLGVTGQDADHFRTVLMTVHRTSQALEEAAP